MSNTQDKGSDPKQNPTFQKVVKKFLTTKPKPKPKKAGRPKPARKSKGR